MIEFMNVCVSMLRCIECCIVCYEAKLTTFWEVGFVLREKCI